jgi:hypothetical protein
MVTDSTQNIPFCAASRRHPTTVDGNDKIHLWHLTMYPLCCDWSDSSLTIRLGPPTSWLSGL